MKKIDYICPIILDIIEKIMNTRLLLASFFVTVCSFNLYSQETTEFVSVSEVEVVEQPKKGAFKTTFQKNRFKDNWTLSLGAGTQVLFGEDDDKGDFAARMTFAPKVSLTKYFSPIWGLRVAFSGGSLHGFNDGIAGTYRKWNSGSKNYLGKGYAGRPGYPAAEGTDYLTWDPSWNYRGWTEGYGVRRAPNNEGYMFDPGSLPGYTNPVPGKTLYMQHVRYVSADINFMFNLMTLFGEYNPKRTFELTPYAGFGFYHVFPHWGQDVYNVLGVNGGLITKFRLTDKIGLFAEFSGSILPDDFDGHGGDNVAFDAIGQLTAGVSIGLGKSTWDVAEPMNYALIDDLMRQINDQQAALAIPCPTCPPCPEPVVALVEDVEKPIVFLPDPVFFRIDKSIIDPSEWIKIEKAVTYLNEHPNANVVVTGYADKKTAYPAYNLKLSERRSKTVAKALIEKYGINPLRVSINWEGDQIQPFDINEWNRVVIFVIE